MSVTVGLFEVFSYAVPGAAYLSVILYGSWLLGARPEVLWLQDSLVGLLALALASFALGHATYSLGRYLDQSVMPRVMRRLGRSNRPNAAEVARGRFLKHCPQALNRPLIAADPSVLLAGIQRYERELGLEVERLRSTGIMARNLVIPLGVSSGLAIASIPSVSPPLLPGAAAVVFALAAISSWRHGQERAVWAHSKILELAYWLPELDHLLDPKQKP